jgi:predicted GNAT family N-acyltransferase
VIIAPGDHDRRGPLHELRTSVFVHEQGVDPGLEQDGLDAISWHVVWGDPPLATGRLVDPGGEVALGRIGRMAVAAHARGQGHGSQVLAQLHEQARALGLVGIELHAQLHAAQFYDRAGYTRLGNPYTEAGIEHVSMQTTWLAGLRPVRDEDAGALQELIRGCWEAYPGVILDIDGEEPWLRGPASLRPGVRMWVIPGSSGLDACVAVAGEELKNLYVSAGARRRGLGELLVRLAQRCGAGRLWTDVKFTDAQRLYSRLGWHPTGQSRELHDRSGTVELELRLR